MNGSKPKVSFSIFQRINESIRTQFTGEISKRIPIVSKNVPVRNYQDAAIATFSYLNSCIIVGPGVRDSIFRFGPGIFFREVCFVWSSTRSEKNKQQEQNIYVCVFHNLFTQQPPLRG